jgi:hypothetical protein
MRKILLSVRLKAMVIPCPTLFPQRPQLETGKAVPSDIDYGDVKGFSRGSCSSSAGHFFR